MAQWASSQDDEQQQGVGDSNTPINKKGPSSNDEIPHPLMDCGQGKNMSDEGVVCVDVTVGVGVDVASGKDGKRTGDGEDDATGNNSAEDAHEAIAGVNYLIAGAPHPINKPLQLRTCESIPPPLHGATPKPLRLCTCESIVYTAATARGNSKAGTTPHMRFDTTATARGNPTLGWFKGGAICNATSLRCNPTFGWFKDGAPCIHQKQHHVPYSLAISINGTFLLIHGIASTLWAFQYVFFIIYF